MEGSSSDQLLCLTDMMATFVAIVGADVLDNGGEDSYNLLPALLNPGLKKPIRNIIISQSFSKNMKHRVTVGN